MKLGVILTTIGAMALLTGFVLATMNCIMGNLLMAFWSFIPFALLGGSLLKGGIIRMRRKQEKEA